MKVLQFEQSSRPATTTTPAGAPARESEQPDADPARQHATADEGHPHEEPGYGHGV